MLKYGWNEVTTDLKISKKASTQLRKLINTPNFTTMFKNTTLRTIAIAATLLAAGAPASASAIVQQEASTQTATGSSKVTMTVPDVIILDYFTSVNLGLAGQTESHDHGTYAQANIGGGDQSFDGTGALTSGTLADATAAALKGSDVTLTMKNMWAVRGFSTSGKATVSVNGPATLTKSGTSSSIGVSKLQVMLDGADASSASNSISANLKGLQKANATMGDVLMSLNFTNTSVSGDYTGSITITAVTM